MIHPIHLDKSKQMISAYTNGQKDEWSLLEEEGKGGKRAREATLEELDIRGVGFGSTVMETVSR